MNYEARNRAQQQDQTPEPEQAERAFDARHARLEADTAPQPSGQHLQRVELMLRSAPFESPSAGFAARVMAAVAAMTFPHRLNRRLSLSLALGLVLAAALTLPLLALGIAALFNALSDPAILNNIVALAASAIGSGYGLAREYAASVDALVSDTPMVPALLTTAIPLAMLVSWLVWYLLDGPRWLLQRAGL